MNENVEKVLSERTRAEALLDWNEAEWDWFERVFRASRTSWLYCLGPWASVVKTARWADDARVKVMEAREAANAAKWAYDEAVKSGSIINSGVSKDIGGGI